MLKVPLEMPAPTAVPSVQIIRAVLREYHAATHTAQVEPVLGPASLVGEIPVLMSCRPDLLTTGREVAVLTWSDVGGLVLGPYGGVPDDPPNAGDADTVDGIHAATTPMANKLLALNGSAKFPADAVDGIGVLGANKVSNGEFAADTSGWTATAATIARVDSGSDPGAGSTGSGASDDWCGKLTDAGSNSRIVQQIGSMIVGRLYRFQALIYNPTANSGTYGANVRIGTADLGLNILAEHLFSQSDAWQVVEFSFAAGASSADAYLMLMGEVANGDVTYWDAVSVRAWI